MRKTVTVILLAILLAPPAYALEKLNFDRPVTANETQTITTWIKTNISKEIQTIKIAKADLNQDNVSEYIVKTDLCPLNRNLCTFVLLADNTGELINLGHFNAKTVTLSTGKTGQRELLVYQNPLNDFDHNLYTWSPEETRYVMTPTKD